MASTNSEQEYTPQLPDEAPEANEPQLPSNYTGDDIKTLDWREHIRLRPGMYIGSLGDGSQSDDGVYVLLKEVLDNAIDEYMMGFGKHIEVTVTDTTITVRDFGRGIPLDKIVDVSSKMNTGAKYDSKAFKKSVGLNGVGIKAVNALSTDFLHTELARRHDPCRRLQACGNHKRQPGGGLRPAQRHTCALHSRRHHIPRLPLSRGVYRASD